MTSPAVETDKITVTPFRAPEGCVAYLVASAGKALIVDPRLDQVDELIDAAKERGLDLVRVLDTHTHADHLSGVREIAKRTGAEALPARDLSDGREIALGDARIRVIATPGHTKDAVSLYTEGHVFTGDALFVGGAGRTDFPGGSASELFDSFRRYETLPDETVVHPGHDYRKKAGSTIGEEKKSNPLLSETDRDALVRRMDIKGSEPANLKPILEYNQEGPDPDRATPVEVDNLLRLRNGVELIDIRSPGEWESERIKGAKHIPLDELSRRLPEVDKSKTVVVHCRTGTRTRDAVRQLRDVDIPARALDGGLIAWKVAGYDVEGSRRLTVERQTQLTIGVFVVLGVTLGVLVHPWFLAIPAFMGAGLIVAGATGTCGLARLLSLFPWNRVKKEEAGACDVGGTAGSCDVGGPPRK